MKTETEKAAHLRDLIQGFSTAMLITRGEGDELHARPMAVAGVDDTLELWFVTGEGSAKAQEIEHDTRANVICQRDHNVYLSVSGFATLVHDPEQVRRLWTESFRVWFPEGRNDPSLVLIRFRPEKAEFWDNSGLNRIAYLWDAAKAYMTGKQPEVREEAHGVVTLA